MMTIKSGIACTMARRREKNVSGRTITGSADFVSCRITIGIGTVTGCFHKIGFDKALHNLGILVPVIAESPALTSA